MIRRLVASATRFKAELAKRLFARRLVLRRETNFLRSSMAYAKINVEKPRIR